MFILGWENMLSTCEGLSERIGFDKLTFVELWNLWHILDPHAKCAGGGAAWAIALFSHRILTNILDQHYLSKI